VPDSGGAGRLRGGNAATMEFKLLAPNAVVTARNRNRSDMAAWGVLGGKAAANSRFIKNPDSAKAQELRNTDLIACAPGDVIRLQGPAGGGYGDPFERPVERVLEDVQCGFVSIERARQAYGVAIGPDFTVDQDATRALRGRGGNAAADHFDYGPGRTRYERVWTPARYAALTRILAQVPVHWRHFVKHHVFAQLGDSAAPADGGAADVERIFGALRERHEDLQGVAA